MRIFTLVVLMLLLPFAGGMQRSRPDALAQSSPAQPDCAPSGTTYLRTTLYFGLSRPAGTIAEKEWLAFLREQVTPRFPEGLTVWEANGQWRRPDGSIGRERAKVLLLVHDGKAAARAALAEIVEGYKKAFQQESVLWETATVCAAF
jgi:hypothetical protein